MKETIGLFFKGIGMGAANVIPGVSGGTIALITGIFEKLIHSIKSFNLTAVRLLFTGKFKELATHVNLGFLVTVFSGVAVSIISLAKLFGFLFTNFPIYIWAFFFGMILASVYFVGKTINKWSAFTIIMFVLGTAVALGLTILKPASENSSFLYLIICGVIAACSMILPGLSGSFVLILLGNYELVMITAVNERNLLVLLPVVIGAGVGLMAFSYLLSWIFKKFKDQTIALLTGFILGSLGLLWPWKHSFNRVDQLLPINKFGAFIDSNGAILENAKPFSYQQILPGSFNSVVLWAIGLMIIGIVSIWIVEKIAENKE
jgi:putative membrane protein